MKSGSSGGFLLVIEGIDGAGKTTQARLLADELTTRGYDVVCTKEPTGGPWGQDIRNSATTGRMPPHDELRAFVEDRRRHVSEVIAPALEEGKVVILDRYYFSTAAYQGARGLPVAEILELNESFAPQPDLLALLDLDADVGLQRVHARGKATNFFENQQLLGKSRKIFLSIDPPYRRTYNARLTPDRICDSIVSDFKILAAKKTANGSLSPREKLGARRTVFRAALL